MYTEVHGPPYQYCNSKCSIIPCIYVSLLLSPQDGKTPLYRASLYGHTAVVRILLENKADFSISRTNVSYSIILSLNDTASHY